MYRRALQIVALSRHTPTGHTMSLASLGKKIQYLLGSSDGWGLYQISSAHPVLDLPMGHLGPRRQVCISVGAADPLKESLPVNEALSHHPEAVGIQVLPHYRATGLGRHTHHLSRVGSHPNPVKQLHKNTKQTM